MIEHNEKIILGGKEYKIRCDINVLIEVQEHFDTVNNFELALVGLKVAKGTDGNTIFDDDGNVVFIRTEPSIKAITTILPVMLAEGGNADIKDAIDVINNFEYDLYEVSQVMHKEYGKCFERKNV